MSKEESGSGGFLLPFIVMGVATQAIGGSYDTVCVVSSRDTVSCTSTDTLSKFLSTAGMSSQMPDVDFILEDGEEPALLICDDGQFFPIGIAPGAFLGKSGEASTYKVEHLPNCPRPTKPSGKKLYGPPDGRGGSICNSRTSWDSCKDCCLGVGIAQASLIAATGKMYRDTKPDPRGLAANAILELSSYGLIYWSQQNCDSNCEVSYEREY